MSTDSILSPLAHTGQASHFSQKIVNILTGIVTLLVFLIGAGAFVLSYDALYATGQQHGSFVPNKVWIFPLLIDAPLVVFTLALLIFQIMRQSVKLWAFLVILYTLATIGFNLSHAQPSPLGYTIAIVAPLGLLLTTEALRHLAKVIIERQAVVSSLESLVAQYDAMAEQQTILSQQIAKSSERLEAIKAETKSALFQQNAKSIADLNAARQEKIDNRRNQVLLMLQEEMSHEEIAKELGFSIRTIRNDIKQLNGKVG